MSQTRTNFLGIPVEGDITLGRRQAPQRPIEQFQPLLRAVLDDPRIAAVGWQQYTPFFNDGDICEFSAGQPWFTTTGLPRLGSAGGADQDDQGDPDPDSDDFNRDEFQVSSYSRHPTLGGAERYYVDGRLERRGYTGPDETLWRACKELSDAIEGGEFEEVLLDAFGDHAEVRVTATGITVDQYDHS